MRRIWAERIVIAIAAVASIATPQKRWSVTAQLPPLTPGKAAMLALEASDPVIVDIRDEAGQSRRLYDEGQWWAGQGRYLIPAGAQLDQIAVTGGCPSGPCSGDCKPPSTAYVRVVSATPIDGWISETRALPVSTELHVAAAVPSYRVTVDATERAVGLQIDGAPPGLAPVIRPVIRDGASESLTTFRVDWYASKAQLVPVTVTWRARATIRGACAGGAAGCAPPAGTVVRILGVESKAFDAP